MAERYWIRINAVDANLDARTVNAIIKEALGKRAISVTQKPELRRAIGEAFVDAVTPFVPMKDGDLRDSGTATDDGRVYWTATNQGFNYAGYVYDEDGDRWGPKGYTKPTTEGTVPRWVEQVQPDGENPERWNAFVNAITPIIVRGFAEDE
jgi:hypothetical protein